MPHEVDIAVGQKIRAFRHLRGMTQQELANQIGCKFQQVQKYETGANRVSASRLHMIAQALHMNILDFFEDVPDSSGKAETLPNKQELAHIHVLRQLSEPQRDAVYSLVQSLE